MTTTGSFGAAILKQLEFEAYLTRQPDTNLTNMAKKFTVVIEKGRKFYIGTVAGFPDCSIRAETLDRLKKM
ncbi:MAG: hypothetical protein HY516_02335 [Candidatus Aenigmarchaeota archaeon]|nr:hypothetical protein [Candidatus Aenigmarchaeota archaeon]